MSASERWSAQREALAVEALRGSGHLRLRVHGESMLPALWPGDVTEIQACSAAEVRRGEIVLTWRDGRFFLHRFLARNEVGFITRGDSVPRPDPASAGNALLGRLVSVNRDGRPIKLRRRPWSRMISMLLCYSSIPRRAALRLHSGKSHRVAAAELQSV